MRPVPSVSVFAEFTGPCADQAHAYVHDMQNGAQNSSVESHVSTGRLLGFVRVVVGGHVCDLTVQAVSFDSDGERDAGGFFVHEQQLGILVDDAASSAQVQAQIEKGTAEAVRHLSQKYLS